MPLRKSMARAHHPRAAVHHPRGEAHREAGACRTTAHPPCPATVAVSGKRPNSHTHAPANSHPFR